MSADRRPGIMSLAGIVALVGFGGLGAPASAAVKENHSSVPHTQRFESHSAVRGEDQAFEGALSHFNTLSDPAYFSLMEKRFRLDHEDFFEVLSTPNEFGFIYFPNGKKEQPRLSYDWSGASIVSPDGNESVLMTGNVRIQLGTDGTLAGPFSKEDHHLLSEMERFADKFFTTPEIMNEFEWVVVRNESTEDDLPIDTALKGFTVPDGRLFFVAGNTKGMLFLTYKLSVPKSAPVEQNSTPVPQEDLV